MIILLLAGAVIGYGITPLLRLVKMLQDEGEVSFGDGESGSEDDFDVAS
jgi:hypothetical protein